MCPPHWHAGIVLGGGLVGTDADTAVVQGVGLTSIFVYLGCRCVSVVCAVTACGTAVSKLGSVGCGHR